MKTSFKGKGKNIPKKSIYIDIYIYILYINSLVRPSVTGVGPPQFPHQRGVQTKTWYHLSDYSRPKGRNDGRIASLSHHTRGGYKNLPLPPPLTIHHQIPCAINVGALEHETRRFMSVKKIVKWGPPNPDVWKIEIRESTIYNYFPETS
jgi:hypothetical protein